MSDASPLQIATSILMVVGIFMAGRCTSDTPTESFGPVVAPEPSQHEYYLGLPGSELFTPPKQFYGDIRVPVTFLLPESVGAACNAPDWAVACNRRNGIILPNPCRWREIESYAEIACHELAHVNGWRHPDRGDPDFPWEKFEGTKWCRPPMLCKAVKP